MSSPSFKKLAGVAAAAATLTGLGTFALDHNANAEPQQYKAPIFGFGSDTTQDVVNAMAGFANGISYDPLVTSSGTGYKQIVNWDATTPGGDPTVRECIATKLGAPLMLRPNGSTEGQKVLSRAAGGGFWYTGLTSSAITAAGCNASRDVSGLVDFARSSSGPRNATGTDLTFLPFGKDALTFAYSKPRTTADGAFTDPVDSLTKAELSTLYTAGVLVKSNGTANVVIVPCGIQTSSGTYSTWNGKLTGVTSGVETLGTAFCNGIGNGARMQESFGPELKAKADALIGVTNAICDGVAGGAAVSCDDVQVVSGFAASGWISKSNGVSSPAPGAGVFLGKADGLVFATFNGAAPVGQQWTPNSAGYSSSTWNRNVYNVVATANLDPITGDAALIEMFSGNTSLVCSATSTIETFGFLSLGTGCGDTALKGGFVANNG